MQTRQAECATRDHSKELHIICFTNFLFKCLEGLFFPHANEDIHMAQSNWYNTQKNSHMTSI